MNVKERIPEAASRPASSNISNVDLSPWTWIKGSLTLRTSEEAGDRSIDYAFYGLHFVPNGTYELYALPDGMRLDVRRLPLLFPQARNASEAIALAELEKELAVQQSQLLISDVRPDGKLRARSELKADTSMATTCPLLVHLTVPPLPPGVSPEIIELYDSELRHPTGIRADLPTPPGYWQGLGLGGVIVADQCGWAMGIEGGTGLRVDEFWRKSMNCECDPGCSLKLDAGFATISQLLVLVLLVRQMESTRTPSTLAKVCFHYRQ